MVPDSLREQCRLAHTEESEFARVTYLKVTLGAHTPGVHHTLRDLLPVELAKLLKKVVVLQEHRTCPARTLLVSVKV